MTASQENVLAAANRLDDALNLTTSTSPVRDLFASGDVTSAYAVQDELNRRRVARGARVVGRKIGLTSAAVQQQLGVDQPDFGVLFEDMEYADGDIVPTARLLQPKVEAEVAFVLGHDLAGDLTPETVRDAVEYAVAAIEIVDSRITDWDITIVDTVADNGSSALFVLGPTQRTLDEFEPREVEMSMSIDGEIVSKGDGLACLGDPLAALRWLATTAQQHGDPLRAGQVVLSGALGPMAPAVAGNTVHAEISHLGSVTVSFAHLEIS